MKEKEKRLSSSNVYKGRIISLDVDEVICFNGQKAKREVVKHRGGVCVLAIDEFDNILIEKQYRYPYDEILYELPAGKLEANEDPYLAALRELEEETGYTTDKLIPYGKIYPTCGYSNEIIYLYLAKNLKAGKVNLDEDENLEVYKMPITEVIELINNDEIVDAKSICLISKYLLNKK